jgi:hypothetical protein
LLQLYSEKEIRDTKLFHVLVGSSGAPLDNAGHLDLPGGEIEAFIRNEL